MLLLLLLMLYANSKTCYKQYRYVHDKNGSFPNFSMNQFHPPLNLISLTQLPKHEAHGA